MSGKIFIDVIKENNIKCIVTNDKEEIEDFVYTNQDRATYKYNIYIGKITRIEPSLQAAFINYGKEKSGFLPFDQIHPIYYQIPQEDRAKLEEEIAQKHQENTDIENTAETAEDEQENEEETIFYEILSKKYKIQDVIKKDQLVLIQLSGDERGNKGAICTTFIGLPGRFCVFKPNSPRGKIGISKRISDVKDRRRILKITSRFNVSDNSSLVVRTAAMFATDKDLKDDFDYLKNLWGDIKNKATKASVGTLIYQELDAVKQLIRDSYNKEKIGSIFINEKTYANEMYNFFKKLIPGEEKKIKFYQEEISMMKKYNLDQKIEELVCERVNLKSGGYLIINVTEALTSIDVNSGKAIQEKNIEETALKTNLEACREIPRQLKLRNLGGLIVVDFIDLMNAENRKLVENEIKIAFERDKAKIQLTKLSHFGLMEISRQRLRSSIYEIFLDKCPNCHGTGRIKNHLIVANEIYENLVIKLSKIPAENRKHKTIIKIECTKHVLEIFLNEFKDKILDIEKKYNAQISFNIFISRLNDNEFSVEFVNQQNGSLKGLKETQLAFEKYRNEIMKTKKFTSKIFKAVSGIFKKK